MADSWQTIEQAAVSLRLSVRTVNRHIVAGKLPSRLNEGRREVLVNLGEGPPSETASASSSPFADRPVSSPDTFAATTGRYDSPSASGVSQGLQIQSGAGAITVDQETVLALADNAAEKAEMAVTAYQALARVADAQAQQVRRNAHFAWAAVAVMAVGVTSAVGWVTYRGTRMSAENQQLNELAARHAQRADEVSAEGQALRAEMVAKEHALREEMASTERALQAEAAAARESAARTEGKLAAYIEQEQARQTREDEARAEAAAMTSVAPAPRMPPATQPMIEQGSIAAVEPEADSASTGPSNSDGESGAADIRSAAMDKTGPGADEDVAAGEVAFSTSTPAADNADPAEPTPETRTASADANVRDPHIERPRNRVRSAKSAGPTTRPLAQRRKARAPTPTPVAPSDTASSSTADQR